MGQSDLGNLLKWARDQLMASGDTPDIDARVLLQHVAALVHSDLIARADETLATDKVVIYRELIRKRRRGMPVAYITGQREFWSLAFNVTPATLIPRPDTELLVERALTHIPENQPFTVADIGTGCGAIALALAHERPKSKIIATDISQDVLTVAVDNGKRLRVHNVECRCGDLLSPLKNNSCNLIVSNPPYIRNNDPHLDQGDVAFEPRTALVGGVDGLDYIRALISTAPVKLAARGWLLIEHGYDQAEEVNSIFDEEAYANIETFRDLSGHERVTQGQLA